MPWKRHVHATPLQRATLAAMALVTLCGCHSLPPPKPLDQLSAQEAAGHGVYGAHCGQCHYDRRSGSLNGPSLAGLFKKRELPSGAAATDERVTATILHGRNNMPAQANALAPGDLPDLLAYLHTL